MTDSSTELYFKSAGIMKAKDGCFWLFTIQPAALAVALSVEFLHNEITAEGCYLSYVTAFLILMYFPLTGETHMGGQEHFYMETQSMLAVPRAEDQEMDIYVSAQGPTFIQVTPDHCGGDVAKWFLPANYTKNN